MPKNSLKNPAQPIFYETSWGKTLYHHRGQGLSITYGWYKIAPLGDVLIALTPRGICFIGLKVDGKRTQAENRLHDYFPAADIQKDTDAGADYATGIEQFYQGRSSGLTLGPPKNLPLDLYGTPFQLTVWRALLDIPFGATVSYHDIAKEIGRETASRAVGGAVGANPVSILVPCHRVIQSNGDITNYAWGTPHKHTLLSMEGMAV